MWESATLHTRRPASCNSYSDVRVRSRRSVAERGTTAPTDSSPTEKQPILGR